MGQTRIKGWIETSLMLHNDRVQGLDEAFA